MQGFIVIGIIIGIGYLAARANVGGPTAQMVLQRFAFFVATPCLMFTLISKENLADVFTSSMAVAFGSAVITGAAFMLLARFIFRLDLADSTVGTLVSMYMNANQHRPAGGYVHPGRPDRRHAYRADAAGHLHTDGAHGA